MCTSAISPRQLHSFKIFPGIFIEHRYFYVFFRLPASVYPYLLSSVILSLVLPGVVYFSYRSLSLLSILVVISSLRRRCWWGLGFRLGFRYFFVDDELLWYTQQNQVLLTVVIRTQTNPRNSKAHCVFQRPYLISIFFFLKNASVS